MVDQVKDLDPRNQYTATAGQTIFPYTFPIFDKDDLVVIQEGSTLTEGTDYTVSGVGDEDGGNVTLTTGATVNDTITIYRDIALERLVDYQDSGDFLASDVNDDFDRQIFMIQQLNRDVQRGLRFSQDDEIASTQIGDLNTRANKLLAFDASGELTYQASTTLSPVADSLVDTVAAAKALNLAVGDYVRTGGYTSFNDGGGALYRVVAGDTGTDDGGSYHNMSNGNQLELIHDGLIHVEQFGVTSSGDKTTEAQAAINFAATNSIEFVYSSTSFTATNLEKLDQVKLVSGKKISVVTVGASTFSLPFQDRTSDDVSLYVATTGSNTTNCGFDSTVPFATVQQALDFLPTNIAHDVVINVADGTYTDVSGKDEFGRGVVVDASRKNISIDRDSSAALNEKKAKIIIKGASESGTILDGTNNSTTRYVVWAHEIQGLQLETITLRNSYGGIISHQNADVTLRDVTTSGCDFGRMIESNSRIEVLRGKNTGNVRNYFIKNGQLQENDSTHESATENGFLIDGNAWVYLLRVDMELTSSKNLFDATGNSWIELDDCNVHGTGNYAFVGQYSHIRLSNDCRVGGLSSAIFGIESGFVDTDGLCHLYNNGFIAFITKGTPVLNLDNCDAKAATGTHDGSSNASTLTDSSQSWVANQFVGLTISNTTDGSSGTITANTATTITATLSGGTDNDWDAGDAYEIEAANTNGLRLQGGATACLIDPDCAITSSDKILSRPTSGLIFKGTAPPSDVNTFYERGSIVLNEAAAVGSPQGWICTTRGYGGTAVFTAMPNL